MANNRAFTKWLQKQFNLHGATLEVTGNNDTATQAMIATFQRAMGLTETGTATAETVKALKAFKPAPITLTGSAEGSAPPQPGQTLNASMELTPQPATSLQHPVSQPMAPPPDADIGMPDMAPPRDDLTGPGGSPAPRYQGGGLTPPQTGISQDEFDAFVRQMNERRPGADMPEAPWNARQEQLNVPLVDPTTGNSPLAGQQSYTPQDRPAGPDFAEAGPQDPRMAALAALLQGQHQMQPPAVAAAAPPPQPPTPDQSGQVGFPWDSQSYPSVGAMAQDKLGALRQLLQAILQGTPEAGAHGQPDLNQIATQ